MGEKLTTAQETALRNMQVSPSGSVDIVGGPVKVSGSNIHARTVGALKERGLVKINKKEQTVALTAKGKKAVAKL